MNENATVMVDAAELGHVVRSVHPARSKDFSFPMLLGLHLWTEGGDLWVGATDRYVVARHRVATSFLEGGALDVVIDRAGADQLVKTLPKRVAGHVTLRLEGGVVSVELASGLGGRLPVVNQGYPDLRRLFPTETRQDDVPATVAWDVRYLDAVLKCVKALDPKGRPHFNMAAGKPTLVTLPGWEGWSALVMPVRIEQAQA